MRRRLLAALLAVVTGTLPVVAGHGRWRFAAAFVMAIVYGSVPLWPRPSTVQKHLFRPPKSGMVLPSSPVADGLKAVAYLLLAMECLAAAGIHSGESLIAWVDRCGHAVAGMLQGLSRKASRSAVKTGTSCARAVAM
jgi:hypothetical protein